MIALVRGYAALRPSMEDYIEASNGLPDPAELQRQQTQIVRLQNALGLTNTTATEEEKGCWERSLEQMILGNYSDEVTLAGTAGQVLLGLTGLDVVTDLRDLSYDLTHFREAGLVQTLLDAVGVIPGLGILKNADEVVTLLKNALPQLMPYADEMATVLRQAFQGGSPALGALAGSTRYADDLAEAGQTARRADDLADAAANGKYVDEASDAAKKLADNTSEWTGQTGIDIIETSSTAGKTELGGSAPHLRRVSDNTLVTTTVHDVTPTEIDLKDWEFDWTIPQEKGCTIRALKASGDDRIQGLIAFSPNARNRAVYVEIVESAPFNNPHNPLFVSKEYSGVGGHLFAEAVRESYEQGFDGYVFFRAKSNLIEHYQEELGATLMNPKIRMMAIEERSARILYEKYYR